MMTRKRIKKRKIALVIIVFTMFFAAYAHHRFGDKPVLIGRLQDKQMDEISGIAASAINPDTYYVHNDSGDSSRFFAMSGEGKLKSVLNFKGDPTVPGGVRDCEDITVGPGPLKNKSYIYLGDIGDNRSNHPFVTIFRFQEPLLNGRDSVNKITGTPLFLKYPDGPRDAETLMLDPTDKLLYIVSKRHDSVTVYSTPLHFKANDTVTLTKRCRLHFKGAPLLKWITGGSISADGQQILLKNYVNVYYWKRRPGEPIWEAMQRSPEELPYDQEHQGEAITFNRDGKSYLTTSEGVYSPIYKYFISN